MRRISQVVALTLATFAARTTSAVAQSSTPSTPHLVLVRLVERGGSAPYAFEPVNVQVERGDTVRFLQTADVPHDVRFTKEPSGAKLGGATTGPYLVSKGQTYDLVIDARFPAGTYSFVCDPHEMLGMRGSMTVASAPTTVGSK